MRARSSCCGVYSFAGPVCRKHSNISFLSLVGPTCAKQAPQVEEALNTLSMLPFGRR